MNSQDQHLQEMGAAEGGRDCPLPGTRWRCGGVDVVDVLEVVQADHIVVQGSQLQAADEAG